MRPSAIALLAANLVPLAGALVLGWSVFEIFALYWAENLVIGVFTILRLWTARPEGRMQVAVALGMTPFFCVHFGLFNFVHSMFIVLLLGPERPAFGDMPFGGPRLLLEQALASAGGFALLALAVSHGISFVTNFLAHERDTPLPKIMTAPYARVAAMHVTLIAGGFLTFTIGSHALVLALLVVAKTFVDLRSHEREHRAATQPPR